MAFLASQRRFITEDPIRDGINWYAYVNNRPLTRIDPTGLNDVGFVRGSSSEPQRPKEETFDSNVPEPPVGTTVQGQPPQDGGRWLLSDADSNGNVAYTKAQDSTNYTRASEEAWALVRSLTGAGAGAIPFAGDFYDLASAIIGKDLVSGDSLGVDERMLYLLASVIVGVPGGSLKLAREGLEAAGDVTRAGGKGTTQFINGVRVVDRRTGTVLEGTVDLRSTLQRIEQGGTFPHRNDGSIFNNRPLLGKTTPELPVKPAGYYTEYVHPTPGIQGPGPQRIVRGTDGDLWYTPDHYDSFIRLNP